MATIKVFNLFSCSIIINFLNVLSSSTFFLLLSFFFLFVFESSQQHFNTLALAPLALLRYGMIVTRVWPSVCVLVLVCEIFSSFLHFHRIVLLLHQFHNAVVSRLLGCFSKCRKNVIPFLFVFFFLIYFRYNI